MCSTGNLTSARDFFHHYQEHQDLHSTLRRCERKKQSGRTVLQHVLATSSLKMSIRIYAEKIKEQEKEKWLGYRGRA